jgi:hypothetical protein
VASKRQPHMTGMLGVYLAAAELSRLGFIVSLTSRSAAGADLLVTDQRCQKAWSVQVKTNRKAINYWLVGERARHIKSDSHVYVFVNLRGEDRPEYPDRPEYLVVPSGHVAAKVEKYAPKGGTVWYTFMRANRLSGNEGWEIFGNAHAPADAADEAEVIDEV